MKDECRVFICFGNSASHYFSTTFQNDPNVQFQTIGASDRGNNLVRRYIINGKIVFVVFERHFSYYSNTTTRELVRILSNAYNV